VFVGVKVAVITEVPALPTVAVVPLREMTEVVADEYVNVPVVDGMGAASVKDESPTFFETVGHVKVGVNLAKGVNSRLTTDPATVLPFPDGPAPLPSTVNGVVVTPLFINS
jgi:hypothetical protein